MVPEHSARNGWSIDAKILSSPIARETYAEKEGSGSSECSEGRGKGVKEDAMGGFT
jgi:hypothetical protein